MKGIRKEPQILTKAQTTTTTIPGRMTGRATSKKACTGEAPATMALSSYDLGMESMKSRRMNMAVGSNPPAKVRMTAIWVSMIPAAEMMRKIGTIAADPETTEEKSSRI
ncbi:hypothetical protein D3C72_2285310 [compost metagenome]